LLEDSKLEVSRKYSESLEQARPNSAILCVSQHRCLLIKEVEQEWLCT